MAELESQKIRNLRLKYRESLLEKLRYLDSLYSPGIAAGVEAFSADSALYAFMHRLAASAGMYGYDELSMAARQVMHLIERENADDFELAMSALRSLLQQLSKG